MCKFNNKLIELNISTVFNCVQVSSHKNYTMPKVNDAKLNSHVNKQNIKRG